jgi:subtilisin-like proprotein convertase family protein
VFNGTLWDVDALNNATDNVYANLVVAPLLSPEGAFDNFLGQDANGTWTLTIVDDAGGDWGTLARWDLNITATATPPSPSAPTNVAGTTGAIPDFGGATPVPSVFTASVSGMGSYLWDLDLTTAITHTSCADIDMTLTSPSGTVVTISTDNGGTNDNVFNGTLWDENANDPCVDNSYANNVTASPLSAEGRLTAFRGENPNGTWMLTITDDTFNDTGSVASWSVGVSTLSAAPATVSSTTSNTTPVLIPPGAPTSTSGTSVDTMTLSGLGTSIAGIKLYTEITHTYSADLDITLTSPAGTTVQVTTDNGGANDNNFNGTSWDPDSTNAVTDYVFANLVVAPLLAPEGSFDNFLGQDPNGTWTLTIVDDLGGDYGSLNRWDLTIDTCGAAAPVSYCTAGTSTNGCQAVLSGTNLSASFASACTVTASNVEGGKSAILFYSISGQNSVLWCAGGTSYLCVKSPTQRTPSQNSGGNPGLCDGSLFIDVNNYLQVVNPTALGMPFTAGNVLDWQGWYRDPPACKTTQLTNGLEMTVQP